MKYLLGLVARIPLYVKTTICRKYAIMRGAKIGEGSTISWSLARRCNSNLTIGLDCAVDAAYIDSRAKVTIGNHVIINKDVSIIRLSHFIDDDHKFTARHYPELKIGDYCWLSTGTKILPRVTSIAKGTVCGAYSVIVNNTEEMGVYGGNPAKKLKNHNAIFDELVVCSLQGCDLPFYIKARKDRSK